jgi:polar amino acid transport system substrate-binding protein
VLLTIPLTHLVNFIDDRLRRGRSVTEPDDPLVVTPAEEMV